MYTEYFGLKQEPFRSRFEGPGIYVGSQQATTISRLQKALNRRDAVAVVTGPVGVGKTTVVSRALDVIAPNRRVARIDRIRLSADELLELLLEKFGVSRKPVGNIERFAAFKRLLDECCTRDSRAIIVVEDARRVGVDALAELEAITAADSRDSSTATLVLMGDTELPAFLDDPALARLQQRIRTRQRVLPFGVTELHNYLEHCLHLAGGGFDALFARGCGDMLQRCSGGIPRMINNICESALIDAADEHASRVSVELVQRVARDVYGIELPPPPDYSTHDDDLELDAGFFSVGEYTPEERVNRDSDPDPNGDSHPDFCDTDPVVSVAIAQWAEGRLAGNEPIARTRTPVQYESDDLAAAVSGDHEDELQVSAFTSDPNLPGIGRSRRIRAWPEDFGELDRDDVVAADSPARSGAVDATPSDEADWRESPRPQLRENVTSRPEADFLSSDPDDDIPILTTPMRVKIPRDEMPSTAAVPAGDEYGIDTLTPEAEELIAALSDLELVVSSTHLSGSLPRTDSLGDSEATGVERPFPEDTPGIEGKAAEQAARDSDRFRKELAEPQRGQTQKDSAN